MNHTTTNESRDDDNRVLALMAALCCIFLVTIIVIIIFTRDVDDTMDWEESTEDYIAVTITPVRPSARKITTIAFPISTGPSSPTPTSAVTLHTTSTGPSSPTPTSAVTVHTTSTSLAASTVKYTTDPPLPLRPLVCSIGYMTQFKNITALPADGICDFLSLLVNIQPTGVATRMSNTTALQVFLAAANSSFWTRFAIEPETWDGAPTKHVLQSPDGAHILKALWDIRIRHYIKLFCSLSGNPVYPGFGLMKKDILEFRKQVTVPWGTRELLTFGVYAYENGPEQNQTFSEADSLGSPCLYNAVNYREKVCPPSLDLKVWKDAPSQTVITLNKQSNKLYTFDDKDTLKQKMCWAAVNYNFNGGWAMLFVETSDTGNKCGDTKYGSDSALVQWMKQYMNITFNAC